MNISVDDSFARPGDKVGYTINARAPVRFRGRIGDAIQPEAIREQMVPVTINRLWGTDLLITDQDLTLSIDRIGERYLDPAAATVANMIDGEGLDLFADVYNMTGTPGTIPNSLATYTQAGVILANHAVQRDGALSAVVNPDMEANILGFAANIFNPAKTISEQYMTGRMGQAVGFKFSMDQNVSRQTVGTLTGSTPLVDGANQTGNTLNIKGLAGGAPTIFKKGDIISITNVNGVNPISFRDFGRRRQFVVTADTVVAATKAAVPISPGISNDVTSPFQTVVNLPVDGAAVFVYETAAANFANITGQVSAQGLCFHKKAFTCAIVPLETPGGLDWSERLNNPKIGLSMRLTRGFDIRENQRYTRIDVLGGWKTLQPERACRVAS